MFLSQLRFTIWALVELADISLVAEANTLG